MANFIDRCEKITLRWNMIRIRPYFNTICMQCSGISNSCRRPAKCEHIRGSNVVHFHWADVSNGVQSATRTTLTHTELSTTSFQNKL